MLQNFREHMQGIIAWVIVGLVAITFALWGIQNYLRGEGGHETVAKVNGTKITQKQLQSTYENLRKQRILQSGQDITFTQSEQQSLKKDALQKIINNEILMQAANKFGFYVGQAQLNAAIYSMPIFQINGVFSPDRFQQVVSAFYTSEDDLIAELKRSLITNQLEEGIVESSFALPSEFDKSIKLTKQTRDVEYLVVSAKNFLPKIVVSPDEIQDYYNKNKEKFTTAEQVSIEYIELSLNTLKSHVDVSDAKLKQFYQDNIGAYSKTQHNQKETQLFDKIKDRVKADYIQHEALQMFSDQNEKLADLTYTNSDSLTPAAEALGLTVQSTGFFAQQGSKEGIANNPKVVKAAFSEAVLKQGYNSNPIEMNQGDLVVLRIKQHIPSAVLPLEKVKTTIEQTLRNNKANEATANLGKKILAEWQASPNAQALQIAKQYNADFHHLAKITRKNDKTETEILNTVFNLPLNTNKESIITGLAVSNGDYVILQVTHSYDGDVNEIKQIDRPQMQNDLAKQLGQFDYASFIKDLRSRSKITTEDKNINSDSENPE